MTLDIICCIYGLIIGIPQLWLAAVKPLPKNLKLAALALGLSAVSAAGAGIDHLGSGPYLLRLLLLIAALVFFLIWLLMIATLARHNTSM